MVRGLFFAGLFPPEKRFRVERGTCGPAPSGTRAKCSHVEPAGEGQSPHQKETMKPLDAKTLPVARLREMPKEELDALAMQGVSIQKHQKDATDTHKQSTPAMGKIVCVMEEKLNVMKEQNLVGSNTSLATHFESITKVKLNNHWTSCANAFGGFVRTSLITEADYDKNSAQALELASSILTACGGALNHKVVGETADLLKDRPDGLVKKLKELLATVKPKKAADEADALKDLAEAVTDLLEENPEHLAAIIREIGDKLKDVQDENALRGIFDAFAYALDRCGTPDQQNKWADDMAAARQPVELKNAA